MACSIAMSVVFMSIILFRAINHPAAPDDFTIYVIQLQEDFLNKSGFWHTIRYFFFPTFGVHTLIVPRCLGLFSYVLLGVINFKFLIVLGNLAYLFMGYKLSGIAKAKCNNDPYLMPIMLSIFLVPMTTNFWTILITTFPFHILFAFLCLYFMTERKMRYMLLFYVLAAFNSAGGVFLGMIILFGLVLYSIREKKYISYVLIMMGVFGLILFFILSFKTPGNPAHQKDIIFSFNAFLSYSVYVMVFIQSAITPLFFNYSSIPLAYVIIGIFILGTLLYLLIYKHQETTHSPFFYLCIYIMLIGGIAAVVRSGGQQVFPAVAARYNPLSVVFMVSLIALVYSYLSPKYIKIGIGVFVILVFFMRFEQNTISKRVGYNYDSMIHKNSQKLRRATRKAKYTPLHKATYNDLSQNASLTPYVYKKKAQKPSTIKLVRFMNEPEFGLVCFAFYEKIKYENVRVILKHKNRVFSLTPTKFRNNRHYAVLAKNSDIPEGTYEVKIHYEVDDTTYEYALDEKIHHRQNKTKSEPLWSMNKFKKSAEQTLAKIQNINGNSVAKAKQPFLINSQDIIIKGIAIDRPHQTSAADVYVKIGKQYFKAKYGKPSKGVVANTKNPKYNKAGFVAHIEQGKIKKGDHEVSLCVVSSDRKVYYEQKNKVRIRVK